MGPFILFDVDDSHLRETFQLYPKEIYRVSCSSSSCKTRTNADESTLSQTSLKKRNRSVVLVDVINLVGLSNTAYQPPPLELSFIFIYLLYVVCPLLFFCCCVLEHQ